MRTLVVSLFAAVLTVNFFDGNLASAADPDRPLKIGVLAALTGDFAVFGTDVRRGAELAASEINAAGGKLSLVFEDDRCLPKDGVTGYKRLVSVEHVDLVVGSGCTGAIVAVGPLAERDGTPVIALLDTNDETKKAGASTYIIGFDAAELAAIVADEMHRLGLKRAGVLYESDAWAELVSDSFKKRFEAEGRGEVTGVVIQQVSDPDYRPNLLKLTGRHPDSLYLVPAYSGGNLMKQIRAAGIKLPLFGPDTLGNKSAIDVAAASAEGMVFGGIVLDTDAAGVKALQEKLKKQTGSPADTVFFAALGYDAVRIGYRALRSPSVKDFLRGMECSDCVNPITRFDESRFAKVKPSLLVIENGAPRQKK